MTIPIPGLDPDLSLLERCRNQDPEALGQIITRHGERVYRALVLIVKDPEDARDLAQETFLRFATTLSSFRGDAGLKGWLLRIATNLALNRLRDRARLGAGHQWVSLDELGDAAPPDAPGRSPEEVVLRRLETSEVSRFLHELSPPLRAVAVLRFHEEMSYEDIARVLDLPVGTVRSRLNAIRWQARSLFAAGGR
jgi:RNA polymerase sigma-70 factor (ECF subfamily)